MDDATLAELARGVVPVKRLREVQTHLPACRKCRAMVADGVRERKLREVSLGLGDTAVLEPIVGRRQLAVRWSAAIAAVGLLIGSLAWQAIDPVGRVPDADGIQRAPHGLVERAQVPEELARPIDARRLEDAGAGGHQPRIAPVTAEDPYTETPPGVAPRPDPDSSAKQPQMENVQPAKRQPERSDNGQPHGAESPSEPVLIVNGRHIRTTL